MMNEKLELLLKRRQNYFQLSAEKRRAWKEEFMEMNAEIVELKMALRQYDDYEDAIIKIDLSHYLSRNFRLENLLQAEKDGDVKWHYINKSESTGDIFLIGQILQQDLRNIWFADQNGVRENLKNTWFAGPEGAEERVENMQHKIDCPWPVDYEREVKRVGTGHSSGNIKIPE